MSPAQHRIPSEENPLVNGIGGRLHLVYACLAGDSCCIDPDPLSFAEPQLAPTRDIA
ncbi:hypothetical protein Tco_0609787, partial [Tanacetum coccineum]